MQHVQYANVQNNFKQLRCVYHLMRRQKYIQSFGRHLVRWKDLFATVPNSYCTRHWVHPRDNSLFEHSLASQRVLQAVVLLSCNKVTWPHNCIMSVLRQILCWNIERASTAGCTVPVSVLPDAASVSAMHRDPSTGIYGKLRCWQFGISPNVTRPISTVTSSGLPPKQHIAYCTALQIWKKYAIKMCLSITAYLMQMQV